jgi:transcriptional antiterminator RfaH
MQEQAHVNRNKKPKRDSTMNIFHAGWYLIYTKPRHEKKIHAHLQELNLNSFLPTRKVLRTWHDRKKYIDEPLFPSYVFVHLTDGKGYYEVMNSDGYLHYVRLGKEVARVSDSVIENIKLVVNHTEEIEVSVTRFQPGRQLVISQGALTGLSCEVVRVDDKQKLLVRVELLQRNILLTFPSEHLMPI